MSDPTYRIDVSYDPHVLAAPWYARVFSLADDGLALASAHRASRELAVFWGEEWVAEESSARAAAFSVYVDDDGRPVEGHSVKA